MAQQRRVAPVKSKRRPRRSENKAKGFVCPWCPGEPLLYVNHTELAAPGIIRRNRRCLICGNTKVTEERESK